MKAKLLIVDDDHDICRMLQTIFAGEGLQVLIESDSDAALQRISSEQPDVAVIDMLLPGKSGIEVLMQAKTLNPALAVIMTTGYRTVKSAKEAMRLGALDFVAKPFNIDRLKTAVQDALESRRFNREVSFADVSAAVHKDLGADVMIGASAEMAEVSRFVRCLAESEAHVLIQGERGTGKELLARAIYTHSRRRSKPFLSVNCACIAEPLLESELFGNDIGPFTSAHTRPIGKFEQCDGGTILLKEVGEMSPRLQSKLIHLLEHHEIIRVGGIQAIKVDVRVISATKNDLISCARGKTFRMDLLYRLGAVTFHLPPLRDRPEDIPLLAEFFARRVGRQAGLRVKGVAPEAVSQLVSHCWKGNVQELQEVMRTATVTSRGNLVQAADIPPLLGGKTETEGLDLDPMRNDCYWVFRSILMGVFERLCQKNEGTVYASVNDDFEKALIHVTMEKSNNNQVSAAKLLGISRNTLRDRLVRYGAEASQ